MVFERQPVCRFKFGEVEMAHFTTRVELHDAAEENYQTLHTEMEELGFTSTIEGHDGATYRLPTVEPATTRERSRSTPFLTKRNMLQTRLV